MAKLAGCYIGTQTSGAAETVACCFHLVDQLNPDITHLLCAPLCKERQQQV